jgi:tetratricopeptide (TPR) repeat protein
VKHILTAAFLLLIGLVLVAQEDPEALIAEAQALQKKRQWKASIELLDKALKQKRDHPDALKARGLAHLQTGNAALAVRDLTKVVDSGHATYTTHYYRGVAFLTVERFEAAQEDLEKAVEMKPDLLQAWMNLGNAYARGGLKKKAVKAYSRVIDARPTDAKALHARGQTNHDLGNLAAAESDLLLAVDQDSATASMFALCSEVLRERRKRNEAVRIASIGIRGWPDDRELRLQRALAEIERGHAAGGVRDLTVIIEADDTDSEAWFHRGRAYQDLLDYPNAIRDYTRGYELDPDNLVCIANRGTVHVRNHSSKKAIADFDQVLKEEPDNITNRVNRGWCYNRYGDWKGGIRAWDEILKRKPSGIYYLFRAFVHEHAGNRSEAKKDLERCARSRAGQYSPHAAYHLKQLEGKK